MPVQSCCFAYPCVAVAPSDFEVPILARKLDGRRWLWVFRENLRSNGNKLPKVLSLCDRLFLLLMFWAIIQSIWWQFPMFSWHSSFKCISRHKCFENHKQLVARLSLYSRRERWHKQSFHRGAAKLFGEWRGDAWNFLELSGACLLPKLSHAQNN